MFSFTHSVHMAGYLFKLLFVFDIILGNVLITHSPLTWAFCLVSDSCARKELVSAGFRVGSTSFRWFRPVSGRFGWFRVVPLFSNYDYLISAKVLQRLGLDVAKLSGVNCCSSLKVKSQSQ